MSWVKSHALPIAAALFMVTGFSLMIAALRIDTTRTTNEMAATAVDGVIPTVATAAVALGTPAASDPRATRLLARAQSASRDLTYGGLKLVSRSEGGRTSSVVVTVAHVAGHGTTVATGDPAMPTATPGASSYTVEAGTDDESAMLAALVRNYELTPAGTAAFLGRPASVVEADRADGSVAARFWIDDRTGLVMRRELVDTSGETVETASYVRVDFHPKVTQVPAVPSQTRAWSIVDDAGVTALRGAGWPVPNELRGGMDLYQVRQQAAAGGPVVQLSYTDGLVAMSVFLQKGSLDSASLSGYSPVTVAGGQVWVRSGSYFFVWQTHAPGGATSTASSASGTSGDIVVSATTDTPLAPIGSALAVLPAEAPQPDGVGDRVSRGVHRVTSWFDPLG